MSNMDYFNASVGGTVHGLDSSEERWPEYLADDVEPWWERFRDEGDCFADSGVRGDEVER